MFSLWMHGFFFPFLVVLFSFSLHFSLQGVKCMVNWVKIWWLTWPVQNLFPPDEALCWSGSMFRSLSCCIIKFLPIRFGCISPYIGIHYVSVDFYVLSAIIVMSFIIIKMIESVPAAMQAQAITWLLTCFTNEAVCLGPWSDPFFSLLWPFHHCGRS